MTEEEITPPDLPPKEPTEPVTQTPKVEAPVEPPAEPKPNTLIEDANLAAKRMEDATAALKIEAQDKQKKNQKIMQRR